MRIKAQQLALSRIYTAAKETLFENDSMPAALTVKLDNNLEADILGDAGIDRDNITERLQEITAAGKPKTQLQYIVRIRPAPETASNADAIIMLTDTLIHELVHVLTCGKDETEHGPAFQTEAVKHGLEIVYDSSGQYANTRITPAALMIVLKQGGYVKCG